MNTSAMAFRHIAAAAACTRLAVRAMRTTMGPISVHAAAASTAPPKQWAPRSSNVPSFRGLFFSKPTGCATLRVMHPQFRRTTNNLFSLHRQGAIVVDIAPPLGVNAKNQAAGFDWAAKHSFFLSATDIFTLAYNPVDKEEDNAGTGTRTFMLQPVDGKPAVTVSIGVHASDGDAAQQRAVELSHPELMLLKHLLSDSVTYITGWKHSLDHTIYNPELHLHAQEPKEA